MFDSKVNGMISHVRRIDDLILPEKEVVLENFKESLILPEEVRFEDYIYDETDEN